MGRRNFRRLKHASAARFLLDLSTLHSVQRIFLLLLARQGIWSLWAFPLLLLGLDLLAEDLLLHGLYGPGLVAGDADPVLGLLLHLAPGELGGPLEGGRVAVQVEHGGAGDAPQEGPAQGQGWQRSQATPDNIKLHHNRYAKKPRL